jgi:pimeloyl-ACP methyl ester carboxylesterase
VNYSVGKTQVHYVERGHGTPVLLLHGAGVDHRELLGTMEPVFAEVPGYRRIYPDLPGQGATPAPKTIRSADDVLGVLLELIDGVVGDQRLLVVGHSAGGYFARAIAHHRQEQVIGLALICPIVGETRNVPPHAAVHQEDLNQAQEDSTDLDLFRSYFVVQTPDTLRSYTLNVAPGADVADTAALQRIGEQWRLTAGPREGMSYAMPVLVAVGRQDSVVGYAGQWDLIEAYPRATFAVLDRAGHALPHEQGRLLAALVSEWLRRVEESRTP